MDSPKQVDPNVHECCICGGKFTIQILNDQDLVEFCPFCGASWRDVTDVDYDEDLEGDE